MDNNKRVLVIGAGLAGSDAASYLARNGVQVVLVDSKRIKKNPAQSVQTFAELVCTNSLKSLRLESAHGVLKYEMNKLGSLILDCADKTKVPAGDALAVDRDKFSKLVTDKLNSNENITIVDEIIGDPNVAQSKFNCDYTIIASGPLTESPLDKWMQEDLSPDDLYFYDAIAPIVESDSLDKSKMYFKDRNDKTMNESGSADYLNIPLNEEQYYSFVKELKSADKVKAKDFEEYKFFESCLPIDIMAERGEETLRFSCMKPIGLELPDGSLPFAAIQLRKENLLGSCFNLVGFQNRLTYGEQLRIFRSLPGLEQAIFPKLGSVHRNTFLHSSKLLNNDLSSKKYSNIFFAGQITGVEGYTESASMGLYAAFQVLRRIQGLEKITFPLETAIGSLINYIMTSEKPVPSNINFGLMPTIKLNKEQRKNRKRKLIKKELMANRAVNKFSQLEI